MNRFTKITKYFLISFVLLATSLFLFQTTPAIAINNCTDLDVSNEITAIVCQPQPRITIPGLNFSEVDDALIDTSGGNIHLSLPFLGEYLSAVYKYAVAAASILAVLVIIVSGIQWMFPGNIVSSVITKAGGERQEEQTNQAKKRILGAVTGLIIALSSYVILYTIDPDLTKFKNLRVQFVEEIDLPDWYLGNTLVDTMDIGSPGYGPMTAGDWSPTLTSCPVNMLLVSPGSDSYNQFLFLQLKSWAAQFPTLSERVIRVAEAATHCQARFGSCGTSAGTIHAMAGSGDEHDTCITGDDDGGNGCNGNRGSEIWKASDINHAFKFGHNCATDPNEEGKYDSHRTNGYNLIDPQIDGTYPRDDCVTNQNISRARVIQFYQQQVGRGELNGITTYPDDILNQLRPGDYISYYNGNKSMTGGHAVIFLGWASNGWAQVISGSSSRDARPHTTCVRAECGNSMLPITGAWHPGS